MSRTLGLWLVRRASWVVAGGILAVILVRYPAFRSAEAWVGQLRVNFAAAALALALTPVILTGGIDLSVGSVTVLAAAVIGVLMRDAGWPVGWTLAGGVLAGLVAGLGNGLLVVAGIPALVATLATRELFRGLAAALIREKPVSEFPEWLGNLWYEPVAGLPLPLYGLGLLVIITYLAVHHTWFGRMVYAAGDNPLAARFAGVPVRGINLALYAWCGLVAGLCGLAGVMYAGEARAESYPMLELTAIACVVLGGVRITGGSGTVPGTVLGTVTLIMLLGALYQVSAQWRDAITGGLLIGVALLNEAAARLAERWSAG